MAQSYIRRQINELCRTANEDYTPTFGVDPVTQAFGDSATEGSSTSVARADHRHGMPNQDEIIDDLETKVAHVEEFVRSSSTDLRVLGTAAFGGYDDTGNTGGFGTVEGSSTTAAGVWIANSTSLLTTAQTHIVKRMRRMEFRVRVGLTKTEASSISALVGAFRTTVNNDATTDADGLYFKITTDGSGVGNWLARAANNGSITSVDTGVSLNYNGDDTVPFQLFRIDYDPDEARVTYYIDGTQVATITENITPSTRKIAGFGGFLSGTVTNRHFVADWVALVGVRVYEE